MQTPIDRVLDALERLGCRPRGHGRRYTARCPVHEDRSPSLSITDGGRTDDRVLLHCFGGCPNALVLEALGLTPAMLFPDYEDDPALRAVAPRTRPKPARFDYSERTLERAREDDWEWERTRREETDACLDGAALIVELSRQAAERDDRRTLIATLRALGDDGALGRTNPALALTQIETMTRDLSYTETAAPLARALDVLEPPTHETRAAS